MRLCPASHWGVLPSEGTEAHSVLLLKTLFAPCLRGTKREKGGTGNCSEYSEYSEYSENSENSEYSEPHLQSVFSFPF